VGLKRVLMIAGTPVRSLQMLVLPDE